MLRKNILKSIERIYATRDREIDCKQLQATLPVYAQAQLNGVDPAREYPAIHAHLVQCPDCLEEYEALLHVASLETQDRLPESESLLSEFEAEPAPEGGAIAPVPHRRKP